MTQSIDSKGLFSSAAFVSARRLMANVLAALSTTNCKRKDGHRKWQHFPVPNNLGENKMNNVLETHKEFKNGLWFVQMDGGCPKCESGASLPCDCSLADFDNEHDAEVYMAGWHDGQFYAS